MYVRHYVFSDILPKKIKTTITIEEELLKEFSKIVIEKEGLRKKNEIIEKLIKQYVDANKGGK